MLHNFVAQPTNYGAFLFYSRLVFVFILIPNRYYHPIKKLTNC